MGITVSKLADYIKPLSRPIETKSVTEATTAKLLIDAKSFEAGLKPGAHAILKMSTSVTLQDGSSCGRTPTGGTTLSDKNIVIAAVKINENICSKTLYSSYYADLISKGQDPEGESLEVSFISGILEEKNKAINLKVENFLWRGDKTLTTNSDLKWIDGIIKQTTASGSGYKDLSAVTGSTVVEKLQAVYKAMPVAVRQAEDFRIFIGQQLFDEYQIELANKNIYKPVEDMKVYGTSAKLVVTTGLNSDTAQEVYAGRLSNFHLGTDGTSDEFTKVKMIFLEAEEQFTNDYHFALGVSVIFPDEMGYGDLAAE